MFHHQVRQRAKRRNQNCHQGRDERIYQSLDQVEPAADKEPRVTTQRIPEIVPGIESEGRIRRIGGYPVQKCDWVVGL